MPRVLARRWYGPRVFEIFLERDTWSFKSGDATLLVLPDRVTARPYSISSSPAEERLGFLVRLFPGGAVSGFLASCPLGTELGTTPPFGRLDLSQPSDMVWLATGTGISPFISALRACASVSPIKLLYGVRTLEEAVDLDLLAARTSLELFISGENRPGCYPGRISVHSPLLPVSRTLRYAACGHGALARHLSDRLMIRGVPQTNIQTEVFFPN